MKKLFFLLAFVLISTIAGVAQSSTKVDYLREGKTFVQAQTSTSSNDTQTEYTWKDKQGVEYPIFITKNGRCYVNRISKKGNTYKYYLPKELCLEICAELGVEYKEK
jgi:hypothetical protein